MVALQGTSIFFMITDYDGLSFRAVNSCIALKYVFATN